MENGQVNKATLGHGKFMRRPIDGHK
jgi:hypothetical protein